MAMALKLYVCLTLLSLVPSVSTGSSHYSHSIASAPSSSSSSSSTQRSHGSSNLHSFSSSLWQMFTRRSRKLQSGSSRGQFAAETRNTTATSMAPAPAPASARNGGAAAAATEKKKKKNPSAVKWFVGIVLGALTGGISALLASFLFKVIRDYAQRPKPGKPVVFQRKVIDAKALVFLGKADTMESLELLGRGGSGAVYKCILENGTAVAIKRVTGLANPPDGGGVDPLLEKSYDLTKRSAQILAELNTLGQIRHRNLLTLLAYIPQPTVHLLIYEYMENGSLHDVLIKVAEKQQELPWCKRLDIAKDVATGLKYLHFECSPMIIHRDLKPGNILLDKAMVAHIGDFGLAKVVPDVHTHITSSNIAGTVGYIAPEYYQNFRYTTKGDVYAFGVILIVLVTGKEPTCFHDVHTHMGDWLARILASGNESAMGVVDDTLHGQVNEAEIILALKVASFCLHEDPRERPNVEDVLKMLNQIGSPQQPPQQPLPRLDLLVDAT